jgi:hypothetical protein
MTLRLRMGQSEILELHSFDGKLFVLVSARAHAPGQPLVLTVELTPPCLLELKSIGSKKRDDDRYEVRARATTLAKSSRERILAALSGG